MEYTLTLNTEQAHAVLEAVELLMRLKINQPEQITQHVMPSDYDMADDTENGMRSFNEWIKRRDKADEHLKQAFAYIFQSWEDIKKDDLWYRLYNLYQVLRYAFHETEHPNSTGVDSYPPTQLSKEPLPKLEWRNEQ